MNLVFLHFCRFILTAILFFAVPFVSAVRAEVSETSVSATQCPSEELRTLINGVPADATIDQRLMVFSAFVQYLQFVIVAHGEECPIVLEFTTFLEALYASRERRLTEIELRVWGEE